LDTLRDAGGGPFVVTSFTVNGPSNGSGTTVFGPANSQEDQNGGVRFTMLSGSAVLTAISISVWAGVSPNFQTYTTNAALRVSQ
jgi:hypothetical protein